MGTETGSDLLSTYPTVHFLGWFFSKTPMHPILRAFLVSLGFYILFLASAILTNWNAVMFSFLHIWQISFSITIFFGIWLGAIAVSDVKVWLQRINQSLKISESDWNRLVRSTISDFGNRWSNAFALPFVIPAVYIALSIALDMPSNLFPFDAFSPAFIFTVIIELCLFMLYLLGATGLWLMYVYTRSAYKLQSVDSVAENLVDDDTLVPLSDIILKTCFFLFLIIASAMPGIAYIGTKIEGGPKTIVTIFGLIMPTFALFASFWFPIYFLRRILVKAREKSISLVNNQIQLCENKIKENFRKGAKRSMRDDEEIIALTELAQSLYRHRSELKRRTTWPFKLYSLLRLVGSSSLPAMGFFGEEIISWLLSTKVLAEM